MIALNFGRSDLTRVRFALSPLVEVLGSVRALGSPEARDIHHSWVSSHRERVDEADLELLRALQPANTDTPDFVNPPPRAPVRRIEDELAELQATPVAQVRAEIERAYGPRGIPAALEPLVRSPSVGLAHLTEVLQRYWDVMIAPHWARMRSILEGDVLYRARQMARGGIQQLLGDIHPCAHFADGRLTVVRLAEPACDAYEVTCDLDGRGLLFVPSVFAWPRVGVVTEPPWQPTLIYPARGIGTLWEPERVCREDALGELMGARRAEILADLDDPRSTTELAERLQLSAPSVSQHLAVLRRAGLVQSSRVGRLVLYMRTSRGDGLVGAPLVAA